MVYVAEAKSQYKECECYLSTDQVSCPWTLLKIAPSHGGMMGVAAMFWDAWNRDFIDRWGFHAVKASDDHRSFIFWNLLYDYTLFISPNGSRMISHHRWKEKCGENGQCRKGIWFVAAISWSQGVPLAQLKLRHIFFFQEVLSILCDELGPRQGSSNRTGKLIVLLYGIMLHSFATMQYFVKLMAGREGRGKQ